MVLTDIIGAKVTKVDRQDNLVTISFDNHLRLEVSVVGDDGLFIDMYKTRTVEEVIEHQSLKTPLTPTQSCGKVRLQDN